MFRLVVCVTAMVLALAVSAGAAVLHQRFEGTNMFVQFEGDANDDWRLQSSGNLTNWTTLANFGLLLSGKATNAPWRLAGPRTDAWQFYRGLKASGLFDPTAFHTIDLTFTQANWATLLSSARTSGSNVYCSLLTLDNGATNVNVGARYKGNTSFFGAGAKKSFNLEFDWNNTNGQLMGFTTINLNNAFGDETIMREPVYFTVMSHYVACPRAAMARVNVNGALWGVFSLAQQENGQLVKEWFPSNDGDRWRTPNAPMGGFAASNSALCILNGGTSMSDYTQHYELRTTNSPVSNAWQRLTNAIYVLNATPTNQLRDRIEEVLGVDSWLWFLAIENIFSDDDSYWNKGADYSFYYAPEDGRIHPLEHDGNEAISVPADVTLSPVQGAAGTYNRPLLFRLLPINELRQRYLAHMRTVLNERFHPAVMTPLIDAFRDLSIAAIIADPNKGYTMTAYTNDLAALKAYVTNRYTFLTNHAELRPLAPMIVDVFDPVRRPTPLEIPYITAQVMPNGTNGIDSVWLYYRDRSFGRFNVTQMFDDGAHGDGVAADGVYGGATTNYAAGNKVHYYVEARSANAARAAVFSPPNAEKDTHAYFVTNTVSALTDVVINELQASNVRTIADPQGEFDDWIELRNVTNHDVDLTGRYLSDEPNNPRKWQFPPGTMIPADGFLIIWMDEDGLAPVGLHASFKLSDSGETIYFADTDTKLNAVLDSVTYGVQQVDLSYGRRFTDPEQFTIMTPSPGYANQ